MSLQGRAQKAGAGRLATGERRVYVNCEALVLRHHRFSETSLIVTLYTREHGRIDALAKGARRPSSPMRGHFDLFALEEATIFLRRRSGLDLVTEAGLIREHTGLRGDARRFAAAGILAEVLLGASLPHDPHPGAFAAAAETFARLAADDAGYQPLLLGLLGCLREFGFLPRLESCPVCQCPAPREGVLSGQYGGLLCAACARKRSRPERALSLHPAEASALRYLLRQNGGDLWRLPAPALLLEEFSGGPGGIVLPPARTASARLVQAKPMPALTLPGDGLGIVAALGEYCRAVLDKPLKSFAVFAALHRRTAFSGVRRHT